MLEQDEENKSRRGLLGILKIALIITVLLIASLATLLATDVLDSEAFYNYLKTLLIVIGIATVSSVVVAMLSSPDKQ